MKAKRDPGLPDNVIVGNWRGMTMYQCGQCPYSTLERAKFIAHVAEMHAPPVVIEHYQPAETPPLETKAEE